MLKNKQGKFKPAKKNGISALLLGVMIGLGSIGAIGGIDYAVAYNQGPTYMPYSEVVQFCDDLDVNMSYFSFENSPSNQNNRAIFPKDGIKLNVYVDNLTEEQKADMQRAVDDLNAVFKVIRPENKFILEFNPSLGDKLNKNNIDVYEMTKSDSEETAGQWNQGFRAHNKNGTTYYHSSIEIKRDFFNYNCFLHEILHHLGFGDAYKNLEALDSYSIMMDANLQSKHMHRNDIAILAARYGDYSTPEKKQALIDYIDSYESQQDWYKEYKEVADVLIDKLATDLKIDKSEINYDLAGKTYIYNVTSFGADKSYNMISFDKHKMEHDTIEISMSTNSNDITTSYTNSGFFEFLDEIDGIEYSDSDTLGTSIYCDVNGTLYRASQVPPVAIGKLASEQDIEEYKATKTRWAQNDNSSLIRELADALYPSIINHIPKVDQKISSGDNIKLYNETLGEITIGDKVTTKNGKFAFEYYRGGIFIPLSSNDAIFIFPDYFGKYQYIKASRFGSTVRLSFETLSPLNAATSQNIDIDKEI